MIWKQFLWDSEKTAISIQICTLVITANNSLKKLLNAREFKMKVSYPLRRYKDRWNRIISYDSANEYTQQQNLEFLVLFI